MSSPSIHEYLNRRTVEEEEEQEDEVDDSISIDSDDANFTNLSSRLGRLTNSQKKKFVKQRVEAAKWTSQPLSDEDYLLCPSWVFAFLLEEKMWVGYVLLDCLESIAWKADPYEFLQLPSEKKIFIKSLVQGFGARRVAAESSGGQQAKDDEDGEEFDDIIEGKGRGLIFLLHGPPGLGKTLTAGK